MEKFNNIEMSEKCGIKCDSEKCDYYDETVLHSELEAWINKPCPKCGENLLTLEDYESSKMLENIVNAFNTISPEQIEEMTKNLPKIEGLNGNITMTVDTHKGMQITDIKKATD